MAIKESIKERKEVIKERLTDVYEGLDPLPQKVVSALLLANPFYSMLRRKNIRETYEKTYADTLSAIETATAKANINYKEAAGGANIGGSVMNQAAAALGIINPNSVFQRRQISGSGVGGMVSSFSSFLSKITGISGSISSDEVTKKKKNAAISGLSGISGI